jgi:hypothetical protein
VIVPVFVCKTAAVALRFSVGVASTVPVSVCFSVVAMGAEFLGAVTLAGAEENQRGGS